jgi:ribosomal protein S12 methylthiotransferase accessory factor YcaO
VREGEFGPDIVRSSSAERLLDDVVTQTRLMMDNVKGGNVAIVCPDAMTESVSAVLTREGVQHGRANNTALEAKLQGLSQTLERKADAGATEQEIKEIKRQIHDQKHNILSEEQPLLKLT